MKTIYHSQDVIVPKNVELVNKARVIKVTGPRGTIEKSFRHANLKIETIGKKRLRVMLWQGTKKEMAIVRTIASHIQNMIKGVTKGVVYKMRAVAAHFPINISILEDGKLVEIRNFLGQKVVRYVRMKPGVTFATSTTLKDEYIISGIDVDSVSQSAAAIHQSVLVRGLDIRKFLDGIYVSDTTTMEA